MFLCTENACDGFPSAASIAAYHTHVYNRSREHYVDHKMSFMVIDEDLMINLIYDRILEKLTTVK